MDPTTPWEYCNITVCGKGQLQLLSTFIRSEEGEANSNYGPSENTCYAPPFPLLLRSAVLCFFRIVVWLERQDLYTTFVFRCRCGVA